MLLLKSPWFHRGVRRLVHTGKNATEGVVDSMDRVFRGDSGIYQGLYVVDGSIIPSSLGVNPSLTISELVFRIAENE
ncbi:MAG: GMC oxidoreductase [Nitrososphaeraceae archaeon]